MTFDDRSTKREVRGMWWTVAGVTFAVIAVVLFVLMMAQEFNPDYEPPPIDNRTVVETDPTQECPLFAFKPGGVVEIMVRPGHDEMVVGDVPHGTELDVISQRVDFIEVRRPVRGFIDRRQTDERCE